jgi:mannose/fructose-specific phosphotransferase system component IIA
MSDAPTAIVIAHGDLAAGLVSAVEQITGRGELFIPLSNSGMSASEMEAKLRELLDRTGARSIFTDLPAGSCNFVACRLLKERPELVVVTGVNLPTLLHFATHDELPTRELADQAVQRGAPALRVIGGK